MTAALNPVLVGVISNRLTSIVNEQQSTLVATAFSSVVRESYDLACAVFDSHGDMICQSIGGTPGHINAMATGMHHFVAAFPDDLVEGDVLITNDPWMTAGQINDLNIATPVFRDGVVVGWFATCCHAPDIGGRIISAAANDVFEEGLRLPIMKLVRGGVLNADLLQIVRVNVRTPDETVGDILAQVAANEVGRRGLLALLDEFGLDSIDPVASEITRRSERALRDALAALDDGTFTASVYTDGYGNEPLVLKATVTIDGENITVDHAGSSPQSAHGINVVMNYTRAYTSFAVKAAIAPDVPHNAGSFRPVHVTAPAGSVLNCIDPAPVAARHLVGHFLPTLLFNALRPMLPERLLADSGDAVWMTVWRGADAAGAAFNFTVFQSGGMGARAVKDGLSATGFPSGLRGVPTEIIESMTPMVQRCKELRVDSGGAGRWRGGLGQRTEMACRSGAAWTVNGNVDRTSYPALGALGGKAGGAGRLARGGTDLPRKQLVHLAAGDVVEVDPPGAGGSGDPLTRPIESVLADVVAGYVSIASSAADYGVVITYVGRPDAIVRPPSAYSVDTVATAALRSAAVAS
jgi:N-methylhydantoinase B